MRGWWAQGVTWCLKTAGPLWWDGPWSLVDTLGQASPGPPVLHFLPLWSVSPPCSCPALSKPSFGNANPVMQSIPIPAVNPSPFPNSGARGVSRASAGPGQVTLTQFPPPHLPTHLFLLPLARVPPRGPAADKRHVEGAGPEPAGPPVCRVHSQPQRCLVTRCRPTRGYCSSSMAPTSAVLFLLPAPSCFSPQQEVTLESFPSACRVSLLLFLLK